ncbi:MAG: hypothetical protein JWO94_2993 [Verrucomicrobiaceae bacterium]|nr:hypothetical protein [Verrucomicrobiaceae bacterium]
MKPIIRQAIALVAFTRMITAADLTSSGDWVESLNTSSLVSGAGSDLPSNLESISGITVLSVSNITGSWRITARRSASTWDSHVALYVRRTSGGIGSGTITGGDSYVELTGGDSEIFTGSNARGSISVQYKLTGLAHNLPPATYLSSLTFTVQ